MSGAVARAILYLVGDWQLPKHLDSPSQRLERGGLIVDMTFNLVRDCRFGNSEYPATGRTVQSAPEAISYVFNEQGLCTSYTGGAMPVDAKICPG